MIPELGLSDTPITLTAWLVAAGGAVYEGDRVVEILAGPATIDLPAPATGRLVERLAQEDDEVTVGQVVGVIELSERR